MSEAIVSPPARNAPKGTYLSNGDRSRGYWASIMGTIEHTTSNEPDEGTASDLARRLARYRRRVASEGRARSLPLIDRAIEDAGKTSNGGR
jgi:hypothetical protein